MKFSYVEKKEPLIVALTKITWTDVWSKFWLLLFLGPVLFIISILFVGKDCSPWCMVTFISIPLFIEWMMIVHSIVSWSLRVL